MIGPGQCNWQEHMEVKYFIVEIYLIQNIVFVIFQLLLLLTIIFLVTFAVDNQKNLVFLYLYFLLCKLDGYVHSCKLCMITVPCMYVEVDGCLPSPVECHYNAVQYHMILHTALQCLQQNVTHKRHPISHPHR